MNDLIYSAFFKHLPGLEVYERTKSGTGHYVGSGNRAIRSGDDIELRRDDLVDILHRSAQNNIIYKFSNRITHLVQDTDKVRITLADQSTATFDFVVGADGIYSTVRKLTFAEEQQFTYFLNYYLSVFEVNAGRVRKTMGICIIHQIIWRLCIFIMPIQLMQF